MKKLWWSASLDRGLLYQYSSLQGMISEIIAGINRHGSLMKSPTDVEDSMQHALILNAALQTSGQDSRTNEWGGRLRLKLGMRCACSPQGGVIHVEASVGPHQTTRSIKTCDCRFGSYIKPSAMLRGRAVHKGQVQYLPHVVAVAQDLHSAQTLSMGCKPPCSWT